ncbi:unnamed protein product [Lupinus luteus]|uniref:Fructose-1-6-bisphosphatase class I N-terminal domain-containing protein n=1 Tax=Lupinus luteus TaxID=3873 RepID=A0AAV1XNY0_LUPLU
MAIAAGLALVWEFIITSILVLAICGVATDHIGCLLASEEVEEAIFVPPSQHGKYIVVLDPLDGFSNIDCGVSIGIVRNTYLT